MLIIWLELEQVEAISSYGFHLEQIPEMNEVDAKCHCGGFRIILREFQRLVDGLFITKKNQINDKEES